MTSGRSMVLRSVHLPPEMDEQLRALAFGLRVSKADLIRGFVGRGLDSLQPRLEGQISEAERDRILRELGDPELSESERSKSDETMRRMRLSTDESLSRSPR